MTFFLNGPDDSGDDIDYKPIRDLPHNKPYRAFVEDLWTRYKPSGDGEAFLKDAKRQFRQRFWEMYLYCALIDQGITVNKTGKAGPDFSFEVLGRKYWVEAIVPTAGTGIDQAPVQQLGRANYVQEEQIKLRYTQAIDTKFKKWNSWKRKSKVSDDDGYIIAINGRGIPDADCDLGYPYIIQSLYPIGRIAYNIDKNSLEVSEPYLLREDNVKKQNGVLINTAWFIDKKYAQISAVIHSFAGFTSGELPLGGDFILVHNCFALHPLPDTSFPWCKQYSFESGRLMLKGPTTGQLPPW